MTERILITKVKRTSATQAELFGSRHKYADLRLFDLAELEAIGVDIEALQIGVETPARFWAHYQLSEKLNSAGNPYKDIIALERADSPATTTSTDNSAVLAELRAIRALLEVLVGEGKLPVPQPVEETNGNGNGNGNGDTPAEDHLVEFFEGQPAPEPERVLYADGQPVSENDAERKAFAEYVKAKGMPPLDVNMLRAWVRETRSQ